MTAPLTRRQALRLALLGSLGGLLPACASEQAAQNPSPAATVAAAPPTPVPATAVPATAVPATAVPTNAPSTSQSPIPNPQPPTPNPPPTPALTSEIAQAATRLLDGLDGEPLELATFAFDDAERVRWHWTTPSGFPRNGLPLRDMSAEQRTLALALLRASTSEEGYRKAMEIMALQSELGNDPELYYVSLFGNPGSDAPWGWRWEGHHLSRHFTVQGDTVTATPFFLGAWPTTSDAGLRAMPREEDAARELISSLAGPQRDAALFQTRTLTQHVTQNEPLVSPLDAVGVPFAELDVGQQALVNEIISTYLGVLPAGVSTPILERARAAGFEQIRFGWAGPLEARRPHYYRLQGPTFLLEFDNSRNGGTHIHSVWRDFEQDFGHHNA